MARERRYALTAIEGPTNVPGLTQDAISGISYQVDSSGTRTPLGGGGGSLPSWWTVDSTPDQERVTFNGGVQSLAPAGYGGKIADFGDEEGNTEFVFDKDGLQFWLEAAKVLDIDHVGAVTISPSDDTLDHLVEIVAPAGLADNTSGNGDILQLKVGSDILFQFDVYGDLINRSTGTTVVLDQFTADGARVSVGASSFGAYVNGYNGDGTAALWKIGPQAQGGTMLDLPTADPTVAGQLWNDSGTVKVSAG